MKFRIASVNNIRRIAAANLKLNETKAIEKEVFEKTSFDDFWTLIWVMIGDLISCFNHRSLMEAYVLQDKEAAKNILMKIFIKVATNVRASTQWYGYSLHTPVEYYHSHDKGANLVSALEHAILSIKRGDDETLNKALEALIKASQVDDSAWWNHYEPDTLRGNTWASYNTSYLENPVKLEAPEYEGYSYWSEAWDGSVDNYPHDLYISMDAFKRLLNGGLRLSEPTKIIGKKLP